MISVDMREYSSVRLSAVCVTTLRNVSDGQYENGHSSEALRFYLEGNIASFKLCVVFRNVLALYHEKQVKFEQFFPFSL